MDSSTITAKKRYVDTGIFMSYAQYMTYMKIMSGISKNYEWVITKL